MQRHDVNCSAGAGVLFAWAHAARGARRRPRSAHARRSSCAARSTGLPAVRAGRRSRLGEAARRQGAPALGTARRRRCRSIRFFALNPAMPNLHRLYQGRRGDDRACGRDALSRALALRRAGRAGKRIGAAGPRRHRLAQPRAWRAGGGSESAARRPRVRRRPGDAAGGARADASRCRGRRRASSRRAKTRWRG